MYFGTTNAAAGKAYYKDLDHRDTANHEHLYEPDRKRCRRLRTIKSADSGPVAQLLRTGCCDSEAGRNLLAILLQFDITSLGLPHHLATQFHIEALG